MKLIKTFLLTALLASGNISAREIEVPQHSDMRKANLDSLECLAVNAYHESRSESDIANLMIMAVIHNRMVDKRFPNDYCSVVFQKHQFSWTNDNLSDKLHNTKQYVRLYKLAEKFVIEKETILELAEGINHYHTISISPYWKSSMKYKMTLDNHKFYKW